MSLSVDKMCAEKKEMRMPDTIYSLLIEKYFDQASSAALGLSGAFDEFSPLYNTSRKWKGFVINEQCYYFTPTSWGLFSDQHITLESIKVFNVNHLYWLPGDLLESTLLKMPNLEELSIKGTKVCTVVQVAKILQSCPKIHQLDFTYTEKSQEEILTGLEKESISLKSFATSFQKLTSLKLSTTVPDQKLNTSNDPWLLVIKMLSFCRDCTDLAVEIAYCGKPGKLEPFWGPISLEKLGEMLRENLAKEAVMRDWLPKLAWMKKLKSLVLVKLGPGATPIAGARIISILLDALTCSYLFPRRERKQPRRPLEHLWIQGFEIHRCAVLQYSSPNKLKSYLSGDCDVKDEKYESFPNLEHLGGTMGINFARPLPSLKKLKYVCGLSTQDQKFFKFCEAHPELEGLSVEYWAFGSDVVSDALCQLPKLKSFSARQRPISKAFIEAMTEAYPILEILDLKTRRDPDTPSDHKAILSAFRFPNLAFLSLDNFQLFDGAGLISIIKECSKLKIVHLKTDSLDSTSFPSNLELFLRSAANLRDFRLEWNHQEDIYSTTAISILKALLNGSVQLERLTLVVAAGPEKLPDWMPPPEFADFLVDFIAKMTHLTCCCLAFNQLGDNLVNEIKQRVEKEVVAERSSLWFHLDRVLPEASVPGVPPVHYHQMVYPMPYFMPRF